MNGKCHIESIGVKIPGKRMTTRELTAKIKIPGIEKFGLLTGIQERRICSVNEDSFSLACDAARDCLEHSKYKADDLDLIICCSITRYKSGLSHLYEPSFSMLIKNVIEARKARTYDISNACAGMLTGVYIAENLFRRGMISTCMIVSGEYISNLYDHAFKRIRTPLSSEISSLTVGDCGAAVILEKVADNNEGLILSGFRTLSQLSGLCTGRQNTRSPGGYMKTKSLQIHKASVLNSFPVVKEALESNGLTFDMIDYLIPHQTSRSSLISGAVKLYGSVGKKPGNLVVNLRDTGNTASTTHFLAIYNYLNNNRFHLGDRIMLLCFASGLILGVVIFRMNEMIHRYGNKN